LLLGIELNVVGMQRVGGQSSENRTPIMVKLRSVWDRRINSRQTLTYYASERIFFNAHKPVEIRHKATFDQLKGYAYVIIF